jgi:hypothetical protein
MRIAKWRAIAILPLLVAAAAHAQTAPNWTEQSPQTSPPMRTSFAMAYDSGHSKVVLFGGAGSTVMDLNLGDTWVWDGSTWTQESPQTSPPAENSHAWPTILCTVRWSCSAAKVCGCGMVPTGRSHPRKPVLVHDSVALWRTIPNACR